MAVKFIFDLDDTLYAPIKNFSPWLLIKENGKEHWEINQQFYSKIYSNYLVQNELNLLHKSGPIYIYTNASKGHAIKCLDILKYSFDDLISLELYNGYYKPQIETYYITINYFKLCQADTIYYFEDMLDNLKTSKIFGWITIFIDNKKIMNHQFYNQYPFVDYAYPDILTAVKSIRHLIESE